MKATDDGPPAAIIRVRWGPNHSYIWYASSLIFDGHEEPHLEGMLVWNAVRKNIDMLFSMDLRSGRVQEQGTMSVDPDGTIVRDITAVYGEGARGLGLPVVARRGRPHTFARLTRRSILIKFLPPLCGKMRTVGSRPFLAAIISS